MTRKTLWSGFLGLALAFSCAIERLGSAASGIPEPGGETATSEAAGVEVETSSSDETEFVASSRVVPERESFEAGEQFEVVLELAVEGEPARIRMGPIPRLEVNEKLRVVRTASGNRRHREPGRVTEVHFHRYTVEGVVPGEGKVLPTELEYQVEGEEGMRSLRAPGISVSIRPASPATPTWWQKLLVAVGIPAIGIAGAGAILIAKRKRQRRAEASRETGPQPWEQALGEAQRKRYEGDPRAYLDGLAETLRLGLGEKLGLGERPGVSAIRERLAEAAEDSFRERAQALVEECEAARYARDIPPLEDLDRIAKRIREVLEEKIPPTPLVQGVRSHVPLVRGGREST